MVRSTALDPAVRLPWARGPLPLLYRLFRAPVRRILERMFDLVVEGREHLPPSGPYIVAANHHNYLDGVVLGAVAPEPIRFIVMPRVWRATPLHPLFHRHVGSIPINLERPDPGGLKKALGALAEGSVVGIFPEGPFSVRGRRASSSPPTRSPNASPGRSPSISASGHTTSRAASPGRRRSAAQGS